MADSLESRALVLRSDILFRVLRPDVVEVVIGSTPRLLPMTLYQLALEFAAPRTPIDVYRGLETDASVDDVGKLVQTLVAEGLLEQEASAEGPTIEDVLNPTIFQDRDLLARIGQEVANGSAVAIPNAFDERFADEVHGALDQTAGWAPHEDYRTPFFHYHHHNLYDPSRHPPELLRCEKIFGSASTRRLMSDITSCDCDGVIRLSAALYLPGDHSLPHTDVVGARTVSFVWHLSKDWRPEWGGHFVWCPTGAVLNPSHNCLVLFKVTHQSLHFVSTVTPHARGKRLSVSGWWYARRSERVDGSAPVDPTTAGPLRLLPGGYGTQTRQMPGARGVILL